jgi:hypothetical protein
MNKKIMFYMFSLLILLQAALTGCVAAGAAAAAGAATYSITQDSITDHTNVDSDIVIENFVQVVKDNKGLTLYVSLKEGKVRAEINKKKVYLDVEKTEDKKTKFTIAVRKGLQLLPDKEEAMKLYKELVETLND